MDAAVFGRFSRLINSRWFPLALFLCLSFALYGVSLFGEFVYDDAFFTRNDHMRDVSYLWQTWLEPSLAHMVNYPHYRPLSFFTFALNFLVTGESPFWFHVVNVVLNGATCWLLYLCVHQIFRRRALAWTVALLFAVLPIHSEAVAYIKARDEMLVAFFGLLAWMAFWRAATGPVRRRMLWSLLAAFAALAAFLSKESALVLPGVLGGSLLLLHSRKALMKAWVPLAMQAGAIAAFFALHRIAVGNAVLPDIEILYFGQNPLGYMTWQFVPWTAAKLLFIAVSKTFVPWNLSATYGFNHIVLIDGPLEHWMAPAGVVVFAVLVSLCLWRRTKATPVGIGALTFLFLYLPFSKVPIWRSIDFFAERWLYAPSIGLGLIGGYAAWRLWERHRILAYVAYAAVLVVYVSMLLPRVAVWLTPTSLGESMVRDAPNAVTSYVFLANDRIQYGRFDEAADLVTAGLSITRDHVPLHHVAAVVAMSLGRLDVAEQAVDAAEKLGDEFNTQILRSTLLAKQGRYQQSLDHIRASPWFREDEFRVRLLLALNYWRLGLKQEAERYFDWDATLTEKLTREQKIHMIETY